MFKFIAIEVSASIYSDKVRKALVNIYLVYI